MIAPLLLSVLLQVSPAPQTLTVDLDGDGKPETVSAIPKGRTIDLEVRDAKGRSLARARAPAPGSGASEITLAAGALGSTGALLEVSAAASGQGCRTIWRLRNRELSPVPILGARGRLADCSALEGWTDRWEKPREDAPADYLRERRRPTPDGEHHRIEIYHFTGFELRFDRAGSTAEIAGTPIPDWSRTTLYPKGLIDALFACFDLSPFKTAPIAQIVSDRDDGVFALVVRKASAEDRIAITSIAPGKEKEEWMLTAGSASQPARIRVQVASDHRTPLEAEVKGLGALDQTYTLVARWTGQGIELFANAEDNLALQSLQGPWDSRSGERIKVIPVSQTPTVIDFGNERVSLSITDAPAGADVLLLPHDGSPPKTALSLRGPGVFARLPVTCAAAAPVVPETCRVAGPGEIFRRVGSQLNAR